MNQPYLKIPPWTLIQPNVILNLSNISKKETQPAVFLEKYNRIKENITNYTHIYIDGSKDGHRVGGAAIFNDTHLKKRLPDNAPNFTTELKAIDLALDAVSESEGREFIIFSDSLSVL